MRATSGVRPLVRASLITVLLAGGLALGAPVQGGDEEGGPFISAFSTGEAGCTGNPPLGVDDCRSWEENLATGEASSWELDKQVGLTVDGGAMAASGRATAVELDNADGTLGSLTLNATMEATLTGGGNGAARVDFQAGFPVTSETISVIGQASVEGHGTAIIGGSGDITVEVGCAEEPELNRRLQVLGGAHGGEAGRLNDDSKSESINATVTAVPQSNGTRFCSLRVFLDAQAGTNRANPGSEHGSGKATISLTILAGGAAAPSPTPPGDCALAGTALDGDLAADGHANKLAGIRVELLKDGAVLGSPVGTGQDGRYCLPWDAVPQAIPGTADAGSYELRATLIDTTHEPPLFHTEHQDSQQPISVLFDVAEADWGVASVELPFTQTDTRPWLPDVANIHWQSARFTAWVVDVLQVAPADFGGFKIRAFDPEGSYYTRADNVAHVGDDDSAFDTRNTALSDNPENGEWHEIAHHLGRILDVAPFGTAAACQGRESHGGWTNASTCDSLGEAFAMYVSTIASLELDLGLPGYATPHYGGFGSSEDNDWAPWSSEPGPGGTRIYREDLGVMRLLWDLQDDTPAETAAAVAMPRSGGAPVVVTVHDRIALGGTNLISLLAGLKPETVADIYDFLTTTTTLDASLRTASIDIDGDGSADLSAVDEVFLMHDIRPLGSTGLYQVGSQIGHTPPGAAGLADRRNLEHVAGSVLRLVNTGAGVATFTVSITSESGTSSFSIPVGPGATLDLPISLGAYSRQPLAEGAALPACGAEGARVSTLAVSGPGGVSQSVDNCDFSHRVVATAAGGAALTVTAAGSEPGASGVPGVGPGATGGGVPILLIVGLVVVALIVAGGALLLLRRRGA